MSLTKEDLGEIKKIVDGSAELVKKELRQEIQVTVKNAEDRILTKLSNEISDLANINRAVINRTDEIDCRLKVVERKLGLRSA